MTGREAGRERPILFSGPMVRAILDGTKTQTRRVVKFPEAYMDDGAPPEICHGFGDWGTSVGHRFYVAGTGNLTLASPYGVVGDRLWVRETWRWFGRLRGDGEVEGGMSYRADDAQRRFESFGDPSARWEDFKAVMVEDRANVWKPSIHMPRWASRLSLEITAVRVARLQEITEDDAKAEGVAPHVALSRTHYRSEFTSLWNSLNAKRGYGWDVNPLVWVVEFKRLADAKAVDSLVGASTYGEDT